MTLVLHMREPHLYCFMDTYCYHRLLWLSVACHEGCTLLVRPSDLWYVFLQAQCGTSILLH